MLHNGLFLNHGEAGFTIFARGLMDFHGIFLESRNFPVKRLEESEINML